MLLRVAGTHDLGDQFEPSIDADFHVPLSVWLESESERHLYPWRLQWLGTVSSPAQIVEIWLDETRAIRHVSYLGDVVRCDRPAVGNVIAGNAVPIISEASIAEHRHNDVLSVQASSYPTEMGTSIRVAFDNHDLGAEADGLSVIACGSVSFFVSSGELVGIQCERTSASKSRWSR